MVILYVRKLPYSAAVLMCFLVSVTILMAAAAVHTKRLNAPDSMY
jgi:hypothetical protein